MEDLYLKKCIPCESGTPPLSGEKVSFFINQVPGWDVIEGKHIYKSFKFRNFADGLDFVNTIGRIAEMEGHHPDIELSWGKVGIKLFTHKINGLSDNDFIMAAKINAAYSSIAL